MLAHLSAALAIGLVGLGATIGIAIIGAKSVESMARQPETTPNIRMTMVIAVAFVESIALFAFVISLMLLAK